MVALPRLEGPLAQISEAACSDPLLPGLLSFLGAFNSAERSQQLRSRDQSAEEEN